MKQWKRTEPPPSIVAKASPSEFPLNPFATPFSKSAPPKVTTETFTTPVPTNVQLTAAATNEGARWEHALMKTIEVIQLEAKEANRCELNRPSTEERRQQLARSHSACLCSVRFGEGHVIPLPPSTESHAGRDESCITCMTCLKLFISGPKLKFHSKSVYMSECMEPYSPYDSPLCCRYVITRLLD